jgi:hypothetical protein
MSRKEIGMLHVRPVESDRVTARAVAPVCLSYLAHQSKLCQDRRTVGMAAGMERAVGRSVIGRS